MADKITVALPLVSDNASAEYYYDLDTLLQKNDKKQQVRHQY